MSEKLYACVISETDPDSLQELGSRFAYRIQHLEDGIVFEIGGLRKIFGEPEKISELIRESMAEGGISGNIAISEIPQTAILQARNNGGITVNKSLDQLSLDKLGIDRDSLSVFDSLGLQKVRDLKRIPAEDLISRYGSEIYPVIEMINDGGRFVFSSNYKEKYSSFTRTLDFPIHNLEQIIFLIRHGLERVFLKTAKLGLKTEQLKIILALEDKTVKEYVIKISFPTLEIKFWLKIISLRISNDPPQSGITALELLSYFVQSRSIQNGLFSAATPQPENLLLTVMKIKKLVGDENVGIPVIINQRISNAFGIDPEKLPINIVCKKERPDLPPIIAFSYFQPPLKARIRVTDKKLAFLQTKFFKGKVKEYGGSWVDSGQWWDESPWLSEEWDVELEEGGLYRLVRNGKEWFVTGEYD